ncbi:MAG: hypothetical protein EYC70_01840 [Planctomycetota bacterium]|nr:MAG: hypothetical protein EYC70_01840 [Planctomycetota bacterium]
MRAALPVAVALGLAAVALLILLGGGGEDAATMQRETEPAPAVPAAPADAIASTSEAPVRQELGPPKAGTVAADAASKPAYPVHVQVLERHSHAPIAGAYCKLWNAAGTAQAVTGADGRAVLDAGVPGPAEAVVGGCGAAYVSEGIDCVVEAAAAPPELTFYVAAYPERILLAARDAETQAILPDAVFRGRWGSGNVEAGDFTDAGVLPSSDGWLDYRVPVERRPLVLLVEAPGHGGALVFPVEQMHGRAYVDLPPAEPVPIQVLIHGLPPPEPCTVRWQQERLVSFLPADQGFERWLGPAFHPWEQLSEARTDAAGRISLPFVIRESEKYYPRLIRMDFAAPGGIERSIREFAGGLGAPPWVIELAPATAEVRLTVLGGDGNPAPDCRVQLAVEPQDQASVNWDLRWQTGNTDGAGRFQARLHAPGRLSWELRWADSVLKGAEEEALEPGTARSIEIRLPEPGLPLSGRVVHHDGALLRQEASTMQVGAAAAGAAAFQVHAEVGEDGLFRFDSLPRGEYRIRLYLGRWSVPADEEIVAAGATGVELRLPELVTLKLRVVESITGAPVGRAMITVLEQGGRIWMTRVESDGSFVLDACARLLETVMLSEDGYAFNIIRPAQLSAAELEDLIVPLAPGRRIRLDFVDVNGRPVNAVGGLLLLDVPYLPASFPDLAPEALGGWSEPSARWQWGSAPCQALRLQPVDASGQALGPVLELPAGSEDLARTVSLPPPAQR